MGSDAYLKISKKAAAMQNKPSTLFSTAVLFACLDHEREEVNDWVSKIADEDMRGMDIEALTTQVMAKFHIAPLEIAGENEFEQTFEKNGNQLTVTIPFAGDPLLWLARPNFGSSLLLEGLVDEEGKRLILTYLNPNNTGIGWCQQQFQRRLALIRQNIQSQADMLSQHPTRIANWARRAIDLRKQQMAADGIL